MTVHQANMDNLIGLFYNTCFCIYQFLTRTVWWAVPVIWLPVVGWCLTKSIQMGNTPPQLALMVATGIFLWTLIEYTLHRFLFHIKTESYWQVTLSRIFVHYFFKSIQMNSRCLLTHLWQPCYRGNTAHYLLHGCHHKHPMDGLRLVFPPAATAILCVPVSS